MSTTPDPLPVVTRKRESRLNVPHSRKAELTQEEFDERQARLQAQHAAAFTAHKEREERELKAARERKRYHGLKTSSEKIDGVEEIAPVEAAAIAREQERQIIPSRGPKTDGGNTVIDEGEVPIVRGRTRKITKVEAARARVQAQKKANSRKVIM